MNHKDKYCIHIVDDSELVLNVIIKALKTKNYELSFSVNGKEALEVISKKKPHLIILDVEMPVMDGYTTIKHLKADPATSNIPVIFLTSLTKPEVIKKIFELKASDYLTKPFIDEELFARIDKEIANIELQQSLKEKMAKVAMLMSQDTLTKTYNRLHLTSLINRKTRALDKNGSGIFSLIYIDIDKFNSFNSLHGLKKSDKALREVAAIIQNNIRKNDVVARWEGDRFLIYLPQITKQQMFTVGRNILNIVDTTIFSSATNLTCCVTMMEILEKDNIANIMAKLQTKMKDVKKVIRGSAAIVEN